MKKDKDKKKHTHTNNEMLKIYCFIFFFVLIHVRKCLTNDTTTNVDQMCHIMILYDMYDSQGFFLSFCFLFFFLEQQYNSTYLTSSHHISFMAYVLFFPLQVITKREDC